MGQNVFITGTESEALKKLQAEYADTLLPLREKNTLDRKIGWRM